MIVVTGGAGFIGSNVVYQLNRRGEDDIAIVDHLGRTEKWRNLSGLSFVEYLDKTHFIGRLEAGYFGKNISAVVHLGACSSTTENDADYLMENNFRYTARIAEWWKKQGNVRFVYASSAATYGDGSQGYADDESRLASLRPLNMYGYSKHLFDLHAQRRGWLSECAGLKYFNVFGPNEYHKGDMRSLIAKAYPRVRDEGRMTLFESHRPDYAHGEQRRDFIYVKDAVAMTLWLLDHPDVNGLYNIGTGSAQSWNEVALGMFAAVGRPCAVDYTPMPEILREKYQYFTQADMGKLLEAGCSHQCMSLDAAIRDYAVGYLSHDGFAAD